MSRTLSIGTMLEQVHGLLGTKDLNEWETRFVEDVWHYGKAGKDTTSLTPRQIDTLERIYRRHFA